MKTNNKILLSASPWEFVRHLVGRTKGFRTNNPKYLVKENLLIFSIPFKVDSNTEVLSGQRSLDTCREHI